MNLWFSVLRIGILFGILALATGDAMAQKPIGIHELVSTRFRLAGAPKPLTLFSDLTWIDAGKPERATMSLNQQVHSSLFHSRSPEVALELPVNKTVLTCELVRINLFTDDFTIHTASGQPVAYSGGVHYVGRIAGQHQSLVAISVFADHVVALITPEHQNTLTLTKKKEANHYILYEESRIDENLMHAFCQFQTDSARSMVPVEPAAPRTTNCVRLHYELGYEIFQKCSSDVVATVNWMTTLHTNLAAVFINDQINTAISQIFVWDVPDPYNATYSLGQLNLFKEYRPQLHGDLGQLLTIEPGYLGGIASDINGFCSLKNKYCYSDIEFEYENYPVYSWTTVVLLHEFGHLMGSVHTHNCSWDGGALDNCGPLAGFPNEGNCPDGPPPANGGTIMSFCHLTEYGINLANGFGPQPAALIRNIIDAASCLTTNCAPIIPEYCPSVGNTKEEWIEAVQIGNLYHASGPGGGYSDFTSKIIYAPPGSQVNFTFTPGYLKAVWEENFSVFIDYNTDKDFFDSNERVLDILEVTTPVSGSFTIPQNVSGETRLRLSMQFEEISEPCDLFNYGEVEDYTIKFSAPVTYCVSSGLNANATYIDFFGWGSYQRESVSDGGYHFDADNAIGVVIGSENVVGYSCKSSNNQMKYWKMWIDYNHDGDFDDLDEKIFGRKSKSDKYLTRKFTVPGTAVPGTTRLRLSAKTGSSPSSCEVFDEGEVEDFLITLVPQAPAPVASVNDVRLYPNPASEYIIVETRTGVSPLRLQLYDLTGRLWVVADFNTEQTKHRVELAKLAQGFYLVHLMTADGRQQAHPLLVH